MHIVCISKWLLIYFFYIFKVEPKQYIGQTKTISWRKLITGISYHIYLYHVAPLCVTFQTTDPRKMAGFYS